MSTPQDHRELREMLGAYALGDLDARQVPALRAHLDGCAACRAELAEIAPLAAELRTVDLAALSETAQPPGDLGERIRLRVVQEQALVQAQARRSTRRASVQRTTRRLVGLAAVLALVVGGVGAGALLGRRSPPQPLAQPTVQPSASPSALRIPIETVPVRAAAGVQARTADVIAHTWGVEARFVGSGFQAGRVYRAAFRADDGRLLPAGEFLGTGAEELRCNMQSALLRTDTTAFVVMDDSGAAVLTASL